MNMECRKIQDLLSVLRAKPLTGLTDGAIHGCYVGDLLSDVLANAKPDALWITIQTHRNVVSVASMKDMAAVLFASGRKPDTAVIAEAEEEGIVLLATPLSPYEAAGKLWEEGIR